MVRIFVHVIILCLLFWAGCNTDNREVVMDVCMADSPIDISHIVEASMATWNTLAPRVKGQAFTRKNAFDLQSIMTHELGHALGLDDNDDPSSVMYYAIRPGDMRRGLSLLDIDRFEDDIATLQWGEIAGSCDVLVRYDWDNSFSPFYVAAYSDGEIWINPARPWFLE